MLPRFFPASHITQSELIDLWMGCNAVVPLCLREVWAGCAHHPSLCLVIYMHTVGGILKLAGG